MAESLIFRHCSTWVNTGKAISGDVLANKKISKIHGEYRFKFLLPERISFKFCLCICTNNVLLRIVNGPISIIYHRVMALVNLSPSSFTIRSSLMKLHKNDQSNKSCRNAVI